MPFYDIAYTTMPQDMHEFMDQLGFTFLGNQPILEVPSSSYIIYCLPENKGPISHIFYEGLTHATKADSVLEELADGPVVTKSMLVCPDFPSDEQASAFGDIALKLARKYNGIVVEPRSKEVVWRP